MFRSKAPQLVAVLTLLVGNCMVSSFSIGQFEVNTPSSRTQLNEKQNLDADNIDDSLTILSRTKVGGPSGGYYHRIKHWSSSTKTDMTQQFPFYCIKP